MRGSALRTQLLESKYGYRPALIAMVLLDWNMDAMMG
jgi:hypothetical protein